MKRILTVLLILTMAIVNIFCFSVLLNFQLIDILFHREKVKFEYDNNVEKQELIENLIDFSNREKINIMQYEFIDETDLIIYATDLDYDSKILIKKGNMPEQESFVSNKNEKSKKQSGIIYFPVTNWNIKIYSFNEVKNVGLSTEFYLMTANQKIIEKFNKEFIRYGKIENQKDEINYIMLTNMSLFMVTLFFLITLCIGVFGYILQQRKSIYIMKLWGYSKIKMILVNFWEFYKIGLIFWGLLLLLLSLYLFKNQTFHYGSIYLKMFFVINGLFILLMFFVNVTTQYFVLLICNNSEMLKGRAVFNKIEKTSAIFKIIIIVVMLYAIYLTTASYNALSQKLNAFAHWAQAKEIYKPVYYQIDDSINDDMKADRELNNRCAEFYRLMKNEKNAFLINATNYRIVEESVNEKKYLYDLNTSGEEQIYSPYGKSILIDKNYLKVNSILSENGEPVEKLFKDDPNILNVIVPSQYHVYEDKITKAYLEKFYFDKVVVDNLYNEELMIPLNQQMIDELSIHIIYAKGGQTYFTYDSNIGNDKNQIIDPVVIIYNDSVDTSFIGSYITYALFFEDKSKGSAYHNIEDIISYADIPEIKSVDSIYHEYSENIGKLKWKIFQQVTGLNIMFVLWLLFSIIFAQANFRANIYDKFLKQLFGYSFFKKNSKMFMAILLPDYVVVILASIFLNNLFYIGLLLVLGMIDIGVIFVMDKKLCNQKMDRFIKGEILW